jgi:hypothetical protein
VSLFGFFDNIMGDKNLARNNIAQYNLGNENFDAGTALTSQGIAGLTDLAKQYQDQINSGGLPASLRQQFNVLRGSLSDQAVRNNRSYLANLQQRMRASGGQLSSAAASEYDLQNQQQQGEGLFNATNQANFEEANMALQNTNNLFNRLQGIQSTITGVGMDQRSQALQRIFQSLQQRFQRNKAIADTFAQIYGHASTNSTNYQIARGNDTGVWGNP